MTRNLIAVIFLSITVSYAAFELQTINPCVIARGNVGSLYHYALNPAANTEISGRFIRFDYSRLYGIKGLDYFDVQMGWTSAKQRYAGIGLKSFGNSIYQEKTLEISYARKFTKILSVGIMVNYYHISITGFNESGAFGLTVGTKYYLTDLFKFAILFQNVNSPDIYSDANHLPECLIFGMQATLHPKIEWCAELYKDTEFPFSPRTGLCLKICPTLDIATGVQLNPDRFSCGVSFHWKGLQLDAAFLHHMVLPYTIYCGCGICF
jgi:hypothetical protein